MSNKYKSVLVPDITEQCPLKLKELLVYGFLLYAASNNKATDTGRITWATGVVHGAVNEIIKRLIEHGLIDENRNPTSHDKQHWFKQCDKGNYGLFTWCCFIQITNTEGISQSDIALWSYFKHWHDYAKKNNKPIMLSISFLSGKLGISESQVKESKKAIKQYAEHKQRHITIYKLLEHCFDTNESHTKEKKGFENPDNPAFHPKTEIKEGLTDIEIFKFSSVNLQTTFCSSQ